MPFLYALIVAIVVYIVGTFFDKSPNNKYAGIAALAAFVLVLLGYTGR